uniref:Putative beta-ketomyristoyl-ACP synthase n=1 Tax=Streptomyces griseoviridis TaxID=45398 RepID=B6VRQ2_STRGD|nr:putative beta-ketomyristoyl-ACP synthase [Streptomyces griseoviridis]
MHTGQELRRDEPDPPPPPEPVAIVGIAALYPRAQGVDRYWRFLTEFLPESGAPAPEHRSLADIADHEVDVAAFGIPPAQAGSMARMQLLMLEAARQCLADAGHPGRPLPADRTDVLTGTCFGLDRQYANALRVEGSRYARELERAASSEEAGAQLRQLLLDRLGGSPHDRVGEMASTIPARIATAFKLRGRALALESADATSVLGIAQAVHSLRDGSADAALVLAGQLRENPLLPAALAAKQAADGRSGGTLGEGVGAVLLKRLSSAVADGDRVYATLRACAVRHAPRPGVFRHPAAPGARRATARAACAAAGVPDASVRYVECTGSGAPHETAAEQEAFGGTATVTLGSVRDRLGHTFANAGMAALTKVALALHHRSIPAPGTARDWPADPGGAPRRAAVSGASLTGTLSHLLLEEYVPPAAPAAATGRAPRSRTAARTEAAAEPIAVISYGARFSGAPDADSCWQAYLSGRDRIGPLPPALLDRDLYHAPGALSFSHAYTDHGSPVTVPDRPPPGLSLTPERYAALDPAQRVGLAVAAEVLSGHRPGAPGLTGAGLIAVGSSLGLGRDRLAGARHGLRALEPEFARLPALARMSAADREKLLDLVRERYAAATAQDGAGGAGGTDGGHSPDDAAGPGGGTLDGWLASGTAALIAGEYGLSATPVAVEAACASSLAALDLAAGQLRAGSVDYALAGGVELPCNARDMILCCSLGLLSRTRITPFDSAADGFTPGDGCALFLLKRYADARRDGDPILGVLRGIGASNDAKSLIAPDTDGQARAIRRAFAQAGADFPPSSVDYLEAHGTGTQVGDRVEIAAAARVYAAPERTRPLEVGSAKSFFGHTFAAAGSAGLLRVLLALKAGTLPPNTNLHRLNPALGLAAVPAAVSTQAAPWEPVAGRPRRAAVSSFGTGGINYHLLVEEGPR